MVKEQKTRRCTLDDCAIKDHVDFIVAQFKDIADRLSQNHVELRMSVVKLTENMKYVQRVHERIDNLTEETKDLRAKVEIEDTKLREKIEKNNKTLYKIVGAIMVITTVTPWILKFISK